MQDCRTPNVEESVHTMLMSAAPEGIECLAELAEDIPDLGVPLVDLDEIADGKNIDTHLKGYGSGISLRSFLSSIEWWENVSECIILGRSREELYDDLAFLEQQKKIVVSLHGALASYMSARSAPHSDLELEEDIAYIEALKHYRLFTRAVCDLARQLWPVMNLDWLYRQP
jgi:hypothetical protein